MTVTRTPERRSYVEQVMGLPVSLLLRGPGARDTQEAAAAVYAELRQVDAVFSTYRDDSQVSRLQRDDLGLDDCDPDVREVADLCEQAREATDGAFDAVRPDGRWDPTGLVKGWAAERAARHLANAGSVDWCLNAGGDVVVGSRTGAPFGIGVQDPADPGAVVAVVPLLSGGMATSGTSARGRHLYDPRARQPVDPVASVTVIGPALLWADVWATACFVRGDLAMLPSGHEGLVVRHDGGRLASAGWR